VLHFVVESGPIKGLNGFAATFKAGGEITIVKVNPLQVQGKLTVEALLYPAKTQKQFAAVLGNHPGTENFSGFVIQQDGSPDSSSYYLGYGNGRTWVDSKIKFKLKPETWHYLVLVMDLTGKKMITVADNGEVAAEAPMGNNILKDSDLPMMIANWQNMDRPFNGLLEEAAASHEARTLPEIKKKWAAIKKKFGLP
jgi:hypothetical protein